MKRFQVLDGFCALCVMAVVVYHCKALQGFSEWTFFRNAHHLMAALFIASGFLISHGYGRQIASGRQLRQFLIARVWRIYPLHVAMLLAAIGLECAKLLAEGFGVPFANGSFSGSRTPDQIVPNLLLIQAWWPGFDALSFNYPAWSISVGFYLYLLFGLMSLTIRRWDTPAFCTLALGAWLAFYLGAPLPTGLVLMGTGWFFAGVITYRAYLRVQYLKLDFAAASILELALLITAVWAVTQAGTAPTVALTGLFCLLILLFALEAGLLSRSLRSAPFAWLGKRSYSIYLSHALVIMLVSIGASLVEKLSHQALTVQHGEAGATHRYFSSGSVTGDNLFLLMQLALVLGASALTWRVIEKPFGAPTKKPPRGGLLVDRVSR